MSQASSEDLASTPSSPGADSANDDLQSLRAWTIPKLTAELRRRGIPFPATARKAELFSLLFPPPAAAQSGTQASLQSISSAITQLHSLVTTLSAAVTDVQTRVGTLEVHQAAPSPSTVTTATPMPLLTGTPDIYTYVLPAHLVPAGIRKDIMDGKDINLASLLIAVHDPAENKSYAWGDVSVVLKAKDHRLTRKLNIAEFVLAFGMFRDVLCTVNPNRREELDLYLHAIVDLGYKYGGCSFYHYHRSFSAKAAARLSQFQVKTNWSTIDTELFCRHFAGLRSPLCTNCQSSTHTANWCSESGGRRPPNPRFFPSVTRHSTAFTQPAQADRLGRPIQALGGATICNNFNFGGCNFPHCKLLHVCLTCHKAHPRVSPIGLVKGKFSNKLRLVYDLSTPHCSHIPSLNSLIPSEEFTLKYSTVDSAIQSIILAGAGAWLSKADISDAFKLLPIDPCLWRWHGIKWKGLYYFATKLTFGSKSSPWLFDTFAQSLSWILSQHASCQKVIHYLDDFLLIEKPNEPPVDLNSLRTIFHNLNVPLADKKVEGPAQIVTFLGIILNTHTMQASLPPDKLTPIRTVIHTFTNTQGCTKKQLQSLLGMLNFAIRIIPQGRSFVSRLLVFLSQVQDPDLIFKLDKAAVADLARWDDFLTNWNGISMFIPSASPTSPQIITDAAASTGFAAIFGHHWFAAPWPPEILSIPGFSQSSSMFEIYPIVAAAHVWGNNWVGQTVTFSTDNLATASIINKGRSKSLAIMSFLRRLVQLSLQHQFNVLCVHIPGKCNTSADALSRFNYTTFFSQEPGADPTMSAIPHWSQLTLD
ncbi:uncharacterized protein [Aquarana catesbeiana]|uniref:uncharacterized protein n=1 Tax=Aquarana catesbeiana TaxID=8400 RepID=UPI003CCA6067